MERLKKIKGTLVFKIIVGILAVFIPLNIVMILTSNYLYNQSLEGLIKDRQGVLTLYMRQFDQNNRVAATRLNNLVHQNNDYIRLTREGNEESAAVDALAKVSLKNSFQDIYNGLESAINGVFGIFPERDFILLHIGGGVNDPLAIHLRELDAEQLHDLRGTSLLSVNNAPYLLTLQQYSGGYYGYWVALDQILREWGLDSNDEVYYEFLSFQEYANLAEVYGLSGQQQYARTNGEILIAIPNEDSSLYLLESNTRAAYQSGLLTVRTYVVVLIFLVVAAVPISAWYLTRQVIRPVNRLTGAMRRVDEGDMEYRVPNAKSSEEFTQLSRSFNQMMDNIQQLQFDVYDGEIQRQKVRLRYLSQQIQPHFIINTLNLIYNYEKDEYPLIQSMIVSLVEYFRYVMNVNEDFVQLGEELQHIQTYFDIQQVRYPNRFIACVESNGLDDILIPPLCVQTFAENAIKYALEEASQTRIQVTAHIKSEKYASITIQDNGPGFPQQVCRAFEAFQQGEKVSECLGVGLRNTEERFRLLYDKHASIKIFNLPDGGGACVEIQVPIFQA